MAAFPCFWQQDAGFEAKTGFPMCGGGRFNLEPGVAARGRGRFDLEPGVAARGEGRFDDVGADSF